MVNVCRNEKFPSDEKDQGVRNTQLEFNEGAMKSVEEACDDAFEKLTPYRYPSTSSNARNRAVVSDQFHWLTHTSQLVNKHPH